MVTGGMGFIGCNFIRYMLSEHVLYCPDAEIINIDKIGLGANPENLKDVENIENYHSVKGDISTQK